MLTCEQCGKVTGDGEIGKEWICQDCRVAPEIEEKTKQGINQFKQTKVVTK